MVPKIHLSYQWLPDGGDAATPTSPLHHPLMALLQSVRDHGSISKAAKVLESCRTRERKVRLILGDTSTGEPWLEEHDVVGRIGRSTGSLKVPLLIEPGEHGGCAILCACLLAIVDWETGDFLYRHAAYREADLSIKPSGDADRSWNVLRRGEVVASFRDIGKAGAYLAFMRGATIEPRVFR